MAHNLICGTFSCVINDEHVEYYAKMGMPKDILKSMVGCKDTVKIGKLGDDRYIYYQCIEGFPECSLMMTFKPGMEMEFTDPLTKDKVKVTYQSCKDNHFVTTHESKTMGKLHLDECFGPEGLTMNLTHERSGAKACFKMAREISENGTYQLEKMENFEAWKKAFNFPYDLDQTYRCKLQHINDKVMYYEDHFPGAPEPFCQKYTLDEEGVVEMLGDKYTEIATKVGCHKYAIRSKSANTGAETETIVEFCQNGAFMTMKECRTGALCKIWMKKVCDFSGTYKDLSHFNLDKVAPALGIPMEMLKKMECDPESKTVVKDMGQFFHCKYFSSFAKMPDACFKLDEEFCLDYGKDLPDVQKAKTIATRCGNKLICMCRGKVDYMTVITFTPHFAIKETTICGTDICAKTIMARC